MKLYTPASDRWMAERAQREYDELYELRNRIKHLEMANEALRKELISCHRMHTIERKGKVN